MSIFRNRKYLNKVMAIVMVVVVTSMVVALFGAAFINGRH